MLVKIEINATIRGIYYRSYYQRKDFVHEDKHFRSEFKHIFLYIMCVCVLLLAVCFDVVADVVVVSVCACDRTFVRPRVCVCVLQVNSKR